MTTLPGAKKRAAIYIRISTKKQEEGYSVEFQKEQCLARIKEASYLLDEKHIFIEIHTGTEYRERKVLSQMRQVAYNHEFDILVLYKLDRLARNHTHFAIIREDLNFHGVEIESVAPDDYTNEDSIAGEIIRTVRGYLAEEEHKNIVKRNRDGILAKLRDGKLLGTGKALYGYIWNGRGKTATAYLLNPTIVKVNADGFEWTEGKVVTRIHVMYDDSYTMRQIIVFLDTEGIPTPEGKQGWAISTLHNIVANPFYTGKAEAYKWHWVKEDGKLVRTVTSESERISLPDGLIPPLVALDMFERNQQRLALNLKFSAHRNKDVKDALLRAGYARCGYCGASLVVSRRPNGNIYKCRRKQPPNGDCRESGAISIRVLDAAVWAFAEQIIRDPSIVALKVQEKRQKQQQRAALGELAPLIRRELRLKEIEQEMENLVKLGQEAPYDGVLKTIGGLLAGLEKEKAELENQRQQVLSLDQQYKKEDEAILTFEQKCAMWREKLDGTDEEPDYDFKREVIEFFGIKALVWRRATTHNYDITCGPPSVLFNRS